METNGKDRIIVALDVDAPDKAAALVLELAPHVGCFKIGLELITAIGGPLAVAIVHEAGGKVMCDAKFNDIPNTMAGAARSVAALGVDLFTVHASATKAGVAAAVAHSGAAKVLGVTVLTSMSPSDCLDVFGEMPEDKIASFAADIESAGAHGIVCSPRDLEFIADHPRLVRVTPGVRPTWAAAGDQKRVMTPHDAIMAGADYLVIGRPILHPPAAIGGPAAAARLIADEIDDALRRKAVLASCVKAEDGDGGCGC